MNYIGDMAVFKSLYFHMREREREHINNRYLHSEMSCVALEQANATFGTCDVPQLAPPPPAALTTTSTGGSSPDSNSGHSDAGLARLRWLFGLFSITAFLSLM